MDAAPATQPVWDLPAPRPPLPLPRRAGVVVVGGGITGVSALRWLALRGVDAVLLERDRLAAGASGRNAGFLLLGVAANYAMASRTYGRETAREVWRFTARNHALLAEVLQGRAGYARRGSLTLAASSDEAESLRESEQLLAEDSLPGRCVAPGALLNEDDGEVDPAAAVACIADSIGDAARIHEGVAVLGIEAPRTGDVRVHTARGAEIEAGAVLLATNAYTSMLAETIPIAPVRAQMLATAPVDVHVAARPTYSHWGYRYWRQRDDGRVLLGGWRDTAVDEEVGTDTVPNPAVQRHLDGHLRDGLDVAARVTHRWAGIMGFSPDELPLVGPVDGMPNVHVCGGYTGHGMGFAVNATRVLVAHLTDGAAIPPWLRAGRLPARR